MVEYEAPLRNMQRAFRSDASPIFNISILLQTVVGRLLSQKEAIALQFQRVDGFLSNPVGNLGFGVISVLDHLWRFRASGQGSLKPRSGGTHWRPCHVRAQKLRHSETGHFGLLHELNDCYTVVPSGKNKWSIQKGSTAVATVWSKQLWQRGHEAGAKFVSIVRLWLILRPIQCRESR